MIEFIIYDDQMEFCNKAEKVIKQSMRGKKNYIIKKFNEYNDEFENVIKEDNVSKIYILDIDVPNSISGIDIARKVRKDDWDSIIIMVTAHVELGYEALKAQIMLLDFICKQNECESSLHSVLQKAIHKINDRKVMMFDYNGIFNRVYTDDILYIIRDGIDRKSIIKTTYNEIIVNKTIAELEEELDSRFYLTHRSCLVNTEKIKTVDMKENIIFFENGEYTDYLARDKKRGLRDYVGND